MMLKLEALPVDGHSIFAIGPADEELAVDGASFDQIDYHLGLLRKQAFLDCPGEPMLIGKFPFRGLSQQIVSRLGACVADAYLMHRKTALQFDRAVFCAFPSAELGLQTSVYLDGKTGFGQFDRSARHSESVVLAATCPSGTVSPGRRTSLFRWLWKE